VYTGITKLSNVSANAAGQEEALEAARRYDVVSVMG
jgi:hypothetical protein